MKIGVLEYWSDGVTECWNAGLGDCVVEALETRSNEFLVKKFSELCELCVCFGFGPTVLPLYTEYFSITLLVDCCIFMLNPVCFYA